MCWSKVRSITRMYMLLISLLVIIHTWSNSRIDWHDSWWTKSSEDLHQILDVFLNIASWNYRTIFLSCFLSVDGLNIENFVHCPWSSIKFRKKNILEVFVLFFPLVPPFFIVHKFVAFSKSIRLMAYLQSQDSK